MTIKRVEHKKETYFTNISRKFSNFLLGGGARENVRKCWKFLEYLKDNFFGKYKKYFVHVLKKISERIIFWKKFEGVSRTKKQRCFKINVTQNCKFAGKITNRENWMQ